MILFITIKCKGKYSVCDLFIVLFSYFVQNLRYKIWYFRYLKVRLKYPESFLSCVRSKRLQQCRLKCNELSSISRLSIVWIFWIIILDSDKFTNVKKEKLIFYNFFWQALTQKVSAFTGEGGVIGLFWGGMRYQPWRMGTLDVAKDFCKSAFKIN